MIEKIESTDQITVELVNSLIDQINNLQRAQEERRGPKSKRTMTDEDAYRIMYGDLKASAHKVAALELGLSYGQVYSARQGFTFRHIEEKQEDK